MFAGAAPKCYLYSVQDLTTGEIDEKMEFKVKGKTLNCQNLQTINPRAILETILKFPDHQLSVTMPAQICRNLQMATLYTRPQKKN